MSSDIGSVLNEWEFVPNILNVRKIRGIDGREKIQLRIPLGIFQFEILGRPDGKNPFNRQTYYDYYCEKLDNFVRANMTDNGFCLNSDECAVLKEEMTQFYYRYVCAFAIDECGIVERDTSRNLKILDFMKKYAVSIDDKLAFEKYRPYIIMMNTKARVKIRMKEHRFRDALDEIFVGMDAVSRHFKSFGQTELSENCDEINALNELEKEVRDCIEKHPKERFKQELMQKLKDALKNEEYERAALLRDRLKSL